MLAKMVQPVDLFLNRFSRWVRSDSTSSRSIRSGFSVACAKAATDRQVLPPGWSSAGSVQDRQLGVFNPWRSNKGRNARNGGQKVAEVSAIRR
jgi:hypothetical protein